MNSFPKTREAAAEMQQDVEEALDQAQEAVPDADILVDVEADTLVGVLNAVTSTVSVTEIETDLQDAQKQFTIGRRADAFDDTFVEETEAELTALQKTVATVQTMEDSAAELTEAVVSFQDLNVNESADPDQDSSGELDEDKSEPPEEGHEDEEPSEQQELK